MRFYQNIPLAENKTLTLTSEASHHLMNVLRASINDSIILFNGKGGEYTATILEMQKRSVTVRIEKFIDASRESSLNLHLAQAIARSEKMDWIIQKSVELGVTEITPLLTEHCNVKLPRDRWGKRFNHWQKIIISACEQCGRNILPILNEIQTFETFVQNDDADIKCILHPGSQNTFNQISKTPNKLSLLIGPEGGFSDHEIKLAKRYECLDIQLGPRTLRTETAGIAAISIMENLLGDYN